VRRQGSRGNGPCRRLGHRGRPAGDGRYPITEEQRQTADQVAQLGVPLSALAANAPDTYTVKRGDTLWDISSIFLTSPWRWPELWGMNKEQIANPHLIYPGQMLRLVKSDGRARLELADGQAGQPGDVVRLSPRVRDTGADREAIPSIPARVIEPFLSQAGCRVARGTGPGYPRIVATQEGRVFLGVGDVAYARGITDERVERYHVFRPPVRFSTPTMSIVAGRSPTRPSIWASRR
jgi:LysM repeat protein